MQSWKHWQESLESNGHFIHLVSFLSWNGSIKREECESLLFSNILLSRFSAFTLKLISRVVLCMPKWDENGNVEKVQTFNPLFGSSSIYAQIVVPHVVSLNDTHPSSEEGVQVTSTICFLHNWAKSKAAEIWTFYSIRKPTTEYNTVFENSAKMSHLHCQKSKYLRLL